MPGSLWVINSGSSSLKLSVYADEEPPRLLLRARIEELSTRPRLVVVRADGGAPIEKNLQPGALSGHEGAVEHLFALAGGGVLGDHAVGAVGHRVVHGGEKFDGPVRIDEVVMRRLDALVPLAPLHQPGCLAAIRAVTRRAPHVPQVACFDTAFHRVQPPVARSFALPRRFTEEGVRRYGFHGLSYEYVAQAVPRIAGLASASRVVVAHLGNGASMCAMRDGKSVATTMSFSTLDGLVMGTRCGSVDPGVLLYLLDRHSLGLRGLERVLYEQSGLLGVSGLSSDMRVLLASNEPAAAEAVELFVYTIGRQLGSLAAALQGLDAVVFTGGIGENSAPVRARICRAARWLGVELDEPANSHGGPCISRTGSAVSAWVIPTDEEAMIARHTRQVLAAA